MRRLTFGSGGVDFQARVDYPKLRKDRLERAQHALRDAGMAAAVITRPDNLRYTVALKGPTFANQLRYALVFADHEPVMFELGDMMENQRLHGTWIPEDNWRFAYTSLDQIGGPEATAGEAKRFAEAIYVEMRDRGLEKERLGADALDEPSREALADVGLPVAPARSALIAARMIKTSEEIKCMRLSIDIANVAYASVLESLRPLVREVDVGAAAYKAMVAAGAENPSGRVRTGLHTFELYHLGNTDRRIEPGDLVTVNTCSTTFNNYKNCVYRNFIVGRKPNDEEKAWNTKCYDRVHAVIGEIRPGNTTADAAKHFLPAETWGYEAEQRLIIAELGHGYGMSYEPPVISRVFSFDHPQEFQPGMVIAVESREGVPGKGGVRIEEMVLVTEDGCELMTNWPAAEITPVATIWG